MKQIVITVVTLLLTLVGAFVISVCIGGFIVGVTVCEGAGDGISGIFGKMFMGFIFSAITLLSGGYPTVNTYTGETFDAWPYIWNTYVVASTLSVILLHVVNRVLKRKKSPSK